MKAFTVGRHNPISMSRRLFAHEPASCTSMEIVLSVNFWCNIGEYMFLPSKTISMRHTHFGNWLYEFFVNWPSQHCPYIWRFWSLAFVYLPSLLVGIETRKLRNDPTILRSHNFSDRSWAVFSLDVSATVQLDPPPSPHTRNTTWHVEQHTLVVLWCALLRTKYSLLHRQLPYNRSRFYHTLCTLLSLKVCMSLCKLLICLTILQPLQQVQAVWA